MKTFTQILLFILAVVCLLLSSNHLKAEEQSLILGGISHHFSSEDITNEVHNTVAYIRGDWMVGYFKNSYGEHSYTVNYVFQDRLPAANFQLYVGVVHGYDKCYGKFRPDEAGESKEIVCPIFAPAISFNTGYNWEPQLTLFGDALMLSARYNF